MTEDEEAHDVLRDFIAKVKADGHKLDVARLYAAMDHSVLACLTANNTQAIEKLCAEIVRLRRENRRLKGERN